MIDTGAHALYVRAAMMTRTLNIASVFFLG
jgi:hypothetical protein